MFLKTNILPDLAAPRNLILLLICQLVCEPSLFFGGGTPSLLSLEQFSAVLQAISDYFDPLTDAEISIEANPGTLTPEYLLGLRELGVNRLSMGLQSAHPADLQLLERQHDTFQVIEAVRWARAAGFDNLNLDLIFGLPHQPLERWQDTLEFALGLKADHYALYSLILEHGTPMNSWVQQGLMPVPDGDLAGDMYEWSIARMAQAGYAHYEISNWSQHPGAQCQHNLQYWHSKPYFGLGAGAHGYVNDLRTANVRAPAAYIKRLSAGATKAYPRSSAAINVVPIDLHESMSEFMLMGLRLVDQGVSAQEFEARFGQPLEASFSGPIKKLLNWGLVQWRQDASTRRLALTERGLILGNQVFMQFVD